MGNAIFYRGKQYPSAVSGGSGGGGSGYSETVLWDYILTPDTSGSDITLSDAVTNYDELLFVLKPANSTEITYVYMPVSELEVNGTYAITPLAGYSTSAYFTYNSATSLHIISWATANKTQYQKIIGIKFGSGSGGGGGSSEINYSTTEQQIGTWIDGKPLYQRSFDLRETTFSDGSWTNNILGTHGDGIKIRTFDGKFGLAGYGDLFADYNYYRSSNEFFTACLVTDDDDLSVRPNMYAGVAVKGGIVTIRYTKTTD